MGMTRRDLLQGMVAGAGAIALRNPLLAQTKQQPIPKRKLGNIGWNASIYAVGTAEMQAEELAIPALTELLDAGVNYVDTAPSYMGARSETIVGKALKGRRGDVFLATKTLMRDADGAHKEIQESLKRLQVPFIDLLQIHAVNDAATLDRVLGKGGAIEGLEKAKKEGLIKHIGITGHTRPEVILDAIKRYPFASILVPVSAMDASLHDFATEVVPLAKQKGISIAGMKSLKGMETATRGKFEPEKLLRYACSLPICTLTVGLRNPSEVKQNLEFFRRFKPMTKDEMKELVQEVKEFANDQVLWWKRR